jgi:hypothetical protein
MILNASSGPIGCQDSVTGLHSDPANALTLAINIQNMTGRHDLHFILIDEAL